MYDNANHWKRLHHAVTGLLLITFFLNAFPHVNSIKDIAFYLAVTGFLILAGLKKLHINLRSHLSLPLILLLAWALVTTFTAYDVRESLDSLLSHLVKYLLLVVVTASILATPARVVWLMRTFIVSTLLFCLGAVVYFYFVQGHPWTTRLGFEAAAHNIICFGANLAVLFGIREFRSTGITGMRLLILAAITVCIATTLLTQSRGGVLALSASIVSLFMMERKFKIFVPLLLIFGIGLMVLPVKERFLTQQSLSNTHRLGAIYYYLEVFKDHPLVGIGFAIDIFDNEQIYANEKYFQRIPERFREDRFTVLPHSMMLSVLVRTGIVGVGIYLYLLAAFFAMGLRNAMHSKAEYVQGLINTVLAAMVMFLVGGFFEPVFIHQLDAIFFALLAMNIVLWRSVHRLDDTGEAH